MKPRRRGEPRALTVLLVCLAGACTGDIGDSSESSEQGEETPGNPGPTLIPEDGTYQPFRGADTVYSKSRIWQLTPVQYQAAVSGAVGAPVDLSTLQATGRQEDFMNQADGLQ